MSPSRSGRADSRFPEEARRALLKDMAQALLSEIGARSVYDHMSRRVSDPELQGLLHLLNRDGERGVARLQEQMRSLGARPRRTSFRRRAMARALTWASYGIGVRSVLRLCAHAEESVSRWYNEYSAFFLAHGDRERARLFRDFSLEKQLRARALGAWISNLRRR